MKLIQRGAQGFWSVRVQIDGKDVWRSTGHADKKLAMAWAKDNVGAMKSSRSTEELAEAVRKIRSKAEPLSWHSAWEMYLAAPKKREAGETRRLACQGWWEDFAAYAENQGAPHVGRVTPEITAAYMTHLRLSGRWVRRPGPCQDKLGARSLNVARGVLLAVFEVCWERAGLSRNPFAKISTVRSDSVSREAFSHDQVKELLAAVADNPQLHALVTTCICTGLRAGDAARLAWDDLDLKTGMLRIKTRKTRVNVAVPLLPALRTLLEQVKRKPKDVHVFPELAEQWTSNPSPLTQGFKQVLKKLGFDTQESVGEGMRKRSTRDLHSLRHTFVYLAAEAGIPLPVVQGMVGHMSQEMTMHYANHATEAAKKEHMEKLAGRLAKDEAKPAGGAAAGVPEWILTALQGASPKTAWRVICDLRERLEGD